MRRYKSEAKEFSDINITPFTDVVLVLLLIFMVTSPFLITGALKVKLPKAVSAETADKNGIEVYLNENNQVFLNNKQVSLNELQTAIQLEFLNKHTTEVIINADKNSLHGSFVQLLDILKSAGATKFLIAAEKNEQNQKTF